MDFLDEVIAIFRSRRFSHLLSGTDAIAFDGSRISLKVQKTSRAVRPVGLRFSQFAYVTEVTAGEHVGVGYGEAPTKFIALQKSIAEGVERAIYYWGKSAGLESKSSNGWACHVSRKHAHKSALNELLERDAVLVHWLTRTPMTEIPQDTWPTWLKHWIAYELSNGDRFRVLRVLVSNIGHVPTITTALMDDQGHGAISHATDLHLNQAVAKALSESCRIAHISLQEGKAGGLVDTRVSNAEIVRPVDHGIFYANYTQLPGWIFGPEIPWNIVRANWTSVHRKFNAALIQPSYHDVVAGPLVVSFATSRNVQSLFFGGTEDARKNNLINVNRLKMVAWDGVLNAMPHCVP